LPRRDRLVANDTTRLLLTEAAIIAAILGVASAYLGVRAWHRRPDRPARRRRAADPHMWTVAELRARENANQLRYYPQSPPTHTATPSANQPQPTRQPAQPRTSRRSQPPSHRDSRAPGPRHGR